MRKVVFWFHLGLGVLFGVFIFTMSVTGVLLAFEDPLTSWAESDNPKPVDSDAPRLSLEKLAAKVGKFSSVTVKAGPSEPVVFGLGRGKNVAVDPRTGEVLRSGSSTRDFFHRVEDVHRWLGSRELGKPVTGAANAAFLLIVLGGPVLWWPKSKKKAILAPDLSLTGKARDFNWHNAAGIWSFPVLLAITASGVLMSYEGATAFLYKTLGEGEPAVLAGHPAGPGAPTLDGAFLAGVTLVPAWDAVTVRAPAKPGDPLVVTVAEPSALPPAPRSTLRLDAATGEVLKWEPQAAAGRGRRWRAFARFLHTGEALGLPGRVLAALASAFGALLVWTGLALTWRRWRKR